MPNKKRNAPNMSGRGAKHTELGGGVDGKSNVLNCSANHIKKVVGGIAKEGLALRSTTGATQLATLPKVLQYLGPIGLNTYEGTSAGYLRIATRIKELKEAWEIHTLREDVIGPDGLFHKGVARYVLTGRRSNIVEPQGNLDLGRDENNTVLHQPIGLRLSRRPAARPLHLQWVRIVRTPQAGMGLGTSRRDAGRIHPRHPAHRARMRGLGDEHQRNEPGLAELPSWRQ